MEGKNYYGLNLNWNYKFRFIEILIPKSVLSALKRLNHIPKVSPQYSAYKYTLIAHGQKGSQ